MSTVRKLTEELIQTLWNNRSIDGEAVPNTIRIANAQLVTDYYFENTGRKLPRLLIDSLTEYCLYRGTKSGKSSPYYTDEYPYQTEKQLRKRVSREKSIEFAVNHDTTGNSRAPQTRKNRRELNEAMNVIKWRVSEDQTDNALGV